MYWFPFPNQFYAVRFVMKRQVFRLATRLDAFSTSDLRPRSLSAASSLSHNSSTPQSTGFDDTFNSEIIKSCDSDSKFTDSSEESHPRVNPIHRRLLNAVQTERQLSEMRTAVSKLSDQDTFGLIADKRLKSNDKNLERKKQSRSAADHWTQSFGTLSDDVDLFLAKHSESSGSYAGDDGEKDESEEPYLRLSESNRKHKPFYYGQRILKLGEAGKVYEAVQVLEKQMLVEDRVMPNQFVFTALIGVLGRAGYTKKAFQLFNQMKKFGLAPEDPTYTALFNACSNSPWPVDGLQRTDNLRRLMRDKEYSPNMITFNSMIKAYAMCGGLQQAFGVVDEAIAAGHKPRGPCYGNLLIACNADKNSGMKLAIEVWRLMRRNRVKPLTMHFNLLLRAVRDCGLGDDEFAQQLLSPGQHVTTFGYQDNRSIGTQSSTDIVSGQITGATTNEVLSDSGDGSREQITDARQISHTMQSDELSTECSIFNANLPDLLDPHHQLSSNVVGMNMPQSAHERLALLGGLSGVLDRMQASKAKPDVKTFTILIELIPSSVDAETELLSVMTRYGVQPDVNFYDMLIRKRSVRGDHCAARETLQLMRQSGLEPTIKTFGCLAMSCSNLAKARQLVHDIQSADLIPNVEVCEIFLYQSQADFVYKLQIMRWMKMFQIKPTEKFIEKLESKIQHARNKIVQMERGETVPNFYQSEYFTDGFRRFTIQYRLWLVSMKLEPKLHPWTKFRQPTPTIEKMNIPDEFPPNNDEEQIHLSAQKKHSNIS